MLYIAQAERQTYIIDLLVVLLLFVLPNHGGDVFVSDKTVSSLLLLVVVLLLLVLLAAGTLDDDFHVASLINPAHCSTIPSLPYQGFPFRWSSVSSGATWSPPKTSDQQKWVTLSSSRDSDSGMPNAENTGVTPSP